MRHRSFLILLMSAASVVVFVTHASGPCSNANLATQNPLTPQTTFQYRMLSGVPHQDCIRTAFSRTSQGPPGTITNGAGVVFQEAGSGQTADITLRMASPGQLPTSAAAGLSRGSQDAYGYYTGGVISYSTNTSLISSCDGFLKATLHELGHLMGLADNYGTNCSTIMNQFSGGNDSGGNLPDHPTQCDEDRTGDAVDISKDSDLVETIEDMTPWGCLYDIEVWEYYFCGENGCTLVGIEIIDQSIECV